MNSSTAIFAQNAKHAFLQSHGNTGPIDLPNAFTRILLSHDSNRLNNVFLNFLHIPSRCSRSWQIKQVGRRDSWRSDLTFSMMLLEHRMRHNFASPNQISWFKNISWNSELYLYVCVLATSGNRIKHPPRQSDIFNRYSLERKYPACVSICTRGRCTRRSCSERDETPIATAADRFVWGSARTRRRGSPLCPHSGPRRVSSVSSSAARLSPNSRILKAQYTLHNMPPDDCYSITLILTRPFMGCMKKKTGDHWRIHLPFKLNCRRTYSGTMNGSVEIKIKSNWNTINVPNICEK